MREVRPFSSRAHGAVLGILIAAAAASAQHSAVITLPDSIMEPGTQVTWVKKVPRYCEGPATNGTLVYFTEQHANSDPNWPIWKLDLSNPADTGTRWVASGQNNGLFVDAKGMVYSAQNGKVVRLKQDGSVDATLAASGTGGVSFKQANDLSIGKNGALYFTDLGSSVYYVDPAGQLKTAASGLKGANGVEWVEEQNAVYVLEVNASQISKFDIGAGGALTLNKKFATLTQPDGCDLDSHGNFYVGSYGEGAVHVINANGQDIGKIAFKMDAGQYNVSPGDIGNICNCHFGGTDNKTLFCTGDGGMFSIRLKIPGRAWPAAGATGIGAWPRSPSTAGKTRGFFRIDGRYWLEGLAKKPAAGRHPALPLLEANR